MSTTQGGTLCKYFNMFIVLIVLFIHVKMKCTIMIYYFFANKLLIKNIYLQTVLHCIKVLFILHRDIAQLLMLVSAPKNLTS